MISRNEELWVVAFGGGSGLPVLLRGLRDRVGGLTAVVTVADDGVRVDGSDRNSGWPRRAT